MMLRSNGKRQLRRGAATAELAILLPFLAFLFVIGSDWARIFYTSMTIQNAARNAAYYASEYPGVTDKMVYGYANVYDAAAAMPAWSRSGWTVLRCFMASRAGWPPSPRACPKASLFPTWPISFRTAATSCSSKSACRSSSNQ